MKDVVKKEFMKTDIYKGLDCYGYFNLSCEEIEESEHNLLDKVVKAFNDRPGGYLEIVLDV